MAIHARPYAGEDDYARMRELVRDTFAVGGPPVYAGLGDIDWWRSSEDDPDHLVAQLWLDGERAVGVAWPADPQVDLLVHPHYRALEADMLEWAELRRLEAPECPVTLRAWAYEGDARRRALLDARGYVRSSTCLQYRLRRLGGPIEPRALPPGYRVRNVAGLHEAEARVAVHRDAFAPSMMSLAYYNAALRMPTYRADLDLVVEAPDGSLVAFCIVWWDAANRLGTFEPVGCHSAHRRLGLASAVMAEGLRRLSALGAELAQVTSARGSQHAEALYESLGFPVLDENWAYDRALP
jgi:ribosomal protein S18 acetylase RimI-like enzyme